MWSDWCAAGLTTISPTGDPLDDFTLLCDAELEAQATWNATYAPLGPEYDWERAWVWLFHVAAQAAGGKYE